jgi:large subunit ribosomal protein L23
MALFGSKKNKEDKKVGKPVLEAVKEVKKKEEKKETVAMKDLYAETSPKASSGKTKVVLKYNAANKLLVRPLVTEKATNLASVSKYVFVVDRKANKIEIAKAIQSVYGVKPQDVNIINMKGKKVTRNRLHGQRKNWKKAIVTLSKGETISIYEGV